jgi:hypothetical protein
MWRIGCAPNSIPIYIQQDATLHSLFISGNCSTCFEWYFHPSSGAHTTVSTASGICHTVSAICRYRGRVGTGLSVLWVAYANFSQSLLLLKYSVLFYRRSKESRRLRQDAFAAGDTPAFLSISTPLPIMLLPFCSSQEATRDLSCKQINYFVQTIRREGRCVPGGGVQSCSDNARFIRRHTSAN